MARIWSTGAELQSATSGTEWNTTTGTVAISTSVKRSGNASIRCNPTAGTGFIQHGFRNFADTRTFIRIYLLIASLPSANTAILACSDASVFFPRVVLQTTGKLRLSDGTSLLGTESATLNVNQWYRIELDYNDNAAGNDAVGYLDGVNFSGTINGGDIATWGDIRVGPGDSTTCDLYFDDIAVNDTSGSFQTGLPGAGNIVHMHPDSDGADKQWQDQASGTQGTSTSANIDDNPGPDDATTYNKRTLNTPTALPLDTWNCESAEVAGIRATDAITLVQVGVRAGSTSTTSTGRSLLVRAYQGGGGTAESASIPVNVNGWTTHTAVAPKPYGLTLYQDLDSAVPFTPARLNVLQIGVKADVSSTNEIRYSMLWALVEVVPGPGPRPVMTTSAVQRASF